MRTITYLLPFFHKTFEVNEEFIRSYNWLSKLYGFGEIGEIKNEISNLDIFLQETPFFIRRELVNYMYQLNYYYTKDISINEDKELLERLEQFLDQGPPVYGINIPYQCKKCGLETFIKPYLAKKQFIQHDFIDISHGNGKICKNCALRVTLYNEINNGNQFCIIPNEICEHIWE